jgi:hypothetical protein
MLGLQPLLSAASSTKHVWRSDVAHRFFQQQPTALPACCSVLQINIVMDYASGGSLFQYVQTRNRLREPLAR